MGASFTIDQATLIPAGVADFSREDGLDGGELVTLTSLAHVATFRFRLLWVGQHPAPDTGSVASLAQAGPNTWTFSPDAGVYGTWRIELITDEGTANEDRLIRTFAVKTATQHARIPAPNEFADPSANLVSAAVPSAKAALIQRSETNAPDGITGSPFEVDGSWSTWWRPVADTIATVNNTGGGGAPVTNSPPVNVTKAAAAVGVAADAARADHKHDITTGTPGTTSIAAVAAEGASTALARADHVHAMGTPVNPVDVSRSAAAVGVSSVPAREDHKHSAVTAQPVAIGTANVEGTATSFVRSDHVHDHGAQTSGSLHAVAIPAGANGFMSGADKSKLDGVASGAAALTATAPVDVTKAAAAVGVAADAARADHKHDITTAAPVAVGVANAEGTSTALARADHVHAAGAAAGKLAQVLFTQITVDISTTALVGAPAALMSQAITITANSRIKVEFTTGFSAASNNTDVSFRLLRDAVFQRGTGGTARNTPPASQSAALAFVSAPLAAGTYVMAVDWYVSASTALISPVSLQSHHASLVVSELLP